MSSDSEARALGHASFWDERYANVTSSTEDTPSHEWFRGFDALQEFFGRNLFDGGEGRKGKGKDARVLHLGSGDSVSFMRFFFSAGGEFLGGG